MATLLQLLVIISLLVIIKGAHITNFHDDPTPCTINNRTGICMKEFLCDAEHRYWEGGVLEQSDFRSLRQCPYDTWCCYNGTLADKHTTDSQIKGEQTTDRQTTEIQILYKPTTDRLTTNRQITDRQTTEGAKPCAVGDNSKNNNNNCLAPQTEECPWCVLLYHSSTSYQNAHHPFCLGALVGSKTIITASTCLITAKNKMLYAQLPNSYFPRKNYTILERMSHPNYNTGTHKHDIGLLVMESAVTLRRNQGACLDFVRPLEGFCVGYGFDNNWKMYSTFLQVTDRSCGKAGNSTDAACGTSKEAVCLIEIGAPILCPADSEGGLLLRGIARGICKADKVMFGSIAPSDRWIEEQLALMDIPRDSYILKDTREWFEK